ncbi:MAG: hypothetical protein ABI873_07485 [Marmoricola sp.]
MTLMLTETVVRPGTREVAADLLPTCGCGQALDCCHAGHCPRCGVTLHVND